MRTNRHHLFWPRRAYTSPTERKFRELPCMIVNIDYRAHELLHKYTNPPIKPSCDEMNEALNRHNNGACGCYIETGRRKGW